MNLFASKRLNGVFTCALVGLGMTVALSALTSSQSMAQAGLQAGVLSCRGEGGWGAIITSKKRFRCAFASSDGSVRGRYNAVITKFGLDIGVTGKTALTWLVFGPAEVAGENYVPGSIAGAYAGVGADAAFGIGAGANVLVGGGPGSFTLQPVSIQVQTGVSIAAGVQTLDLEYVGPVE